MRRWARSAQPRPRAAPAIVLRRRRQAPPADRRTVVSTTTCVRAPKRRSARWRRSRASQLELPSGCVAMIIRSAGKLPERILDRLQRVGVTDRPLRDDACIAPGARRSSRRARLHHASPPRRREPCRNRVLSAGATTRTCAGWPRRAYARTASRSSSPRAVSFVITRIRNGRRWPGSGYMSFSSLRVRSASIEGAIGPPCAPPERLLRAPGRGEPRPREASTRERGCTRPTRGRPQSR